MNDFFFLINKFDFLYLLLTSMLETIKKYIKIKNYSNNY